MTTQAAFMIGALGGFSLAMGAFLYYASKSPVAA